MSRNVKFALDRSMRRVDADGHLHVEMTNISKANVCPYYGREIPDWETLGLDANKVYHLYRDPTELKAAAHTFAGKPLLLHHKPTTAEDHADELVVGTVGTDVVFDGTYLRAPLALWTAEAIEAVESEEQKELSPGYRYRADMTPGHTPQGVAFDGVMRDIKGNHVALVAEGRTGPDVFVADETPPEFSTMKFSKVMAALAALFPSAPKPEQLVALDAALAEDLKAAADEVPDLSEDEMNAACDAFATKEGKERAKLTDEDKAEAYKRAAADKATAAKGTPAASSGNTPPHAADEATVKLAVDAAVAPLQQKLDAMDAAHAEGIKAARAEVHALYGARKAVEPTVGVVALDSAEAVYRFALDHLKVEHKDTQAPGLPALYEASAKAAAAPPAIAQDNAVVFDRSILGLSHILKG
jgi:hypothetical protein